MRLITGLFDRARAVLATLALVLIAGTIALEEIPKEAEPDVDLPFFHVSLSQRGLSPEDADQLLVRPLIRELRDLEGLDELRSKAYFGGARLSLEFDPDFDREKTLEALRERLAVAEASLPTAASRARVEEVNLGLFPLIVITLSGPYEPAELLRLARALRDDLETLSPVLSASIAGDRDEVVEVVIDPVLLESYGLDTTTLLANLTSANRPVLSGSVEGDSARLVLTMPGLMRSSADVSALPIKTANGAVLTLGEVAVVQETLEDDHSFARVNGQPSVAISLTKRVGENVFETLERVRETVNVHRKTWPSDVTSDYVQDRSWRIRTRIAELRNSLISAVILVMVIIIAVLGVRPGLLVGLSIPGSFLLAILALAGLGVSINTAVLYAFVMSVGLLVDGAIVMVEDAEERIRQGAGRRNAYLNAVRTLCIPIVTSTGTTLAAFLPLLFWPGVIGEYMRFLPLTVLLTLAGSLIMALLFVPVLGATFGGSKHRPVSGTASDERRVAPGSAQIAAPSNAFTSVYLSMLNIALRYPGWVVALAGAALVWSLWIFERHGQGVEFLPEIEPGLAVVEIRARGELNVAEKRALALDIERLALDERAFSSVLLTVGDTAARGTTSSDVIGTMRVEFRDWHEHRPAFDVLDEFRAAVAKLPGVYVEVRPERFGPTGGKPIRLDVTGRDVGNLNDAVARTTGELNRLSGVRDVEDSRPTSGVEWTLHLDRAEAARYGVNLAKAGDYAQLVTSGLKLGKIRPPDSDEDIDILVRFPERYRSLAGLSAIRIPIGDGTVPLDQIAELRPRPRADTIERIDGVLSRQVLADVERNLPKEHRLGDLMRDIEGWALGTALPPGTAVAVRGEDEDREEAREFLVRAFAAALFLIALILLLQFNSFYHAFLILFAIVLSTIGVRLGLLYIDQPFSVVMSGIGVIALAGIVVNNNIILVATYKSYIDAGHAPFDALMVTGARRFRPVLLTTVTTIAGLMPLVLQIDINYAERAISLDAPTGQYWVQMSSAVVFGLAFATVLTLVITPAALMLRAKVSAARERSRALERDGVRLESISAVFAAHGPAVGFCALTAIIAAWVFIPELIIVRITDIFAKQIFEQPPSRWFQALEWASFWSLIVLGAGYAYWKNAHVRVDIIRERLSLRGKAWVEILGFVFLLLPVSAVILIAGWDFVLRSYLDEEASGALLGSPSRWIFKAMMLICFFQLIWLGGYVTWRNIQFLRGRATEVLPPEPAPLPPPTEQRAERGAERRIDYRAERAFEAPDALNSRAKVPLAETATGTPAKAST